MRDGDPIVTEAQRRLLASWVRAGRTPQRVTRRARIVLLAAEGKSVRAIARSVHVSTRTVVLWRRRYQEHGPDALWRDAPGRGRKPSLPRDTLSRLRALMKTEPPDGARWTVRRLAEATGLSRASVHRVLRSFDPVAGGRSSRRHRRSIVAIGPVSSALPL